jgi:N-acetylneuraminate synthase/N,N'-diacetyllegionaminate synthase
MDIYKIGSGDLNAFQVLEGICNTKKPIILSTGLANIDDVDQAIEFIQGQDDVYRNKGYLSILQCTSMYPIPYNEANLNVMDEYKKRYALAVGYSDHTEGSLALECAVAKGAQILEFHFTDTRENQEFRDHKVSLTKDEIKAFIFKLKEIQTLNGSYIKKPTFLELSTNHVTSFRRGLYLKKDMKVDDIVSIDDIVSLRPNVGIDARNYKKLVGQVLTKDVVAYERLEWEFFSNDI